MDASNKKVIFITGSLSDGGAEKVISILASQCADMGADVTLVILRDKPIMYYLSENVKVYQFKYRSRDLKMIKRVRVLHRILCESESKTVIPFLPEISLYTLIANIGVGKRIIMSERADPYQKILGNKKNLKEIVAYVLMRRVGLFSLADWMVFQTPDAQKYYNKKIQKKSCIIANPLDTHNLPSQYCGEREKTIIAAGRLADQKNFPLLIKGFSMFHKYYQDYKLYIYGQGELRQELEELIRKFNLEQAVFLCGFVENLPEKIYKASMYISTSNYEGISNSMLEALGMGIPTIATDCPVGGSKMFVKTDVNGILIPMNDEIALFKAMMKIAGDSKYAKMISDHAVSVREEVSAEKISRKWLDLV